MNIIIKTSRNWSLCHVSVKRHYLSISSTSILLGDRKWNISGVFRSGQIRNMTVFQRIVIQQHVESFCPHSPGLRLLNASHYHTPLSYSLFSFSSSFILSIYIIENLDYLVRIKTIKKCPFNSNAFLSQGQSFLFWKYLNDTEWDTRNEPWRSGPSRTVWVIWIGESRWRLECISMTRTK